jgi:serine/threonine protein kinase
MADVSSSSDSERDPVEALADEFLERIRRGEQPALTEYIRKYPQWADRIRKMLPAMIAMEGARPESGEESGGAAGETRDAEETCLERLGDFRILREVGRGGMGIVYEAEQESLGRHVALKVLHAQALLNPKHLQRFQREAKAAARLHHTNIVPVFGVGEQDRMPYYVMQFIQGLGVDVVLAEVKRLRAGEKKSADPASADPSVAAIARSLVTGMFQPRSNSGDPPVPDALAPAQVTVASGSDGSSDISGSFGSNSPLVFPGSTNSSSHTRSGRKPTYWQSVAQIGLQVADALAYAHRQGVQHRDIKPSNLLLDLHGTVWVTDFGLAKADDAENLTRTGDILGTLRYMPPEAFEGKADARGDIYSLGLTLYETLALRPAFRVTEKNRLIKTVMEDEPPRLESLNPAIPRDLRTIVHTAIEKDPAHRYATAQALAEDLRRFTADEPIRARRVSRLERAWRWCRRNPALATVTGLAAAALLAVSIISGLFAAAQRRHADDVEAASRQDAVLAADRGQGLIDQGQVHRGMLWLARAVQLAPVGDALQRPLRAQLAELGGEFMRLRAVVPTNSAGWAVAYSPDGRWIAAGFGGGVKVYSAANGQTRPDLPTPSIVTAVAISPDGRLLAAGMMAGTVYIWDAGTGELVRSDFRTSSQLRALAFSPDGQILAAASHKPAPANRAAAGAQDNREVGEGRIRLWRIADGAVVRDIEQRYVTSVGFAPDGRSLVAGSRQGPAWRWNVSSGHPIGSPFDHGSDESVPAVAYRPDGRIILTGGTDGHIRTWDAATGTLRGERLDQQSHPTPIESLAFTADGTMFLSAGGTVRLWWSEAGQVIGGAVPLPDPPVCLACAGMPPRRWP